MALAICALLADAALLLGLLFVLAAALLLEGVHAGHPFYSERAEP